MSDEGGTLLTGETGGTGDGGDEAIAAFKETIPEAFREDPAMAPIQSMEGLVKSFVESQKMIGVPADRLVKIPNEETASEEEWSDYFAKLGRPAEANEYPLNKPSDLPDGLDISDGTIKALSDIFHKYGLTKAQAQGIFNDYNQVTLGQYNARVKESELQSAEAIKGLKQEWGSAWDAKLDMAGRAMQSFGTDEFRGFLDSSGLGDHPEMIKVFAAIGEKMVETKTDTGGSGGFRTLSPAEAKSEISALQADESFQKAYTDRYHPGHQDAVAKMTRLFEYANPDEAA